MMIVSSLLNLNRKKNIEQRWPILIEVNMARSRRREKKIYIRDCEVDDEHRASIHKNETTKEIAEIRNNNNNNK